AGKPLQIVLHALERRALLSDLSHQGTAGRGRTAKNGEEAGVFTIHAPRLADEPINFRLLAIDGVFRGANLLRTGRIGVAAIERGELRLKALASRVRAGAR